MSGIVFMWALSAGVAAEMVALGHLWATLPAVTSALMALREDRP